MADIEKRSRAHTHLVHGRDSLHKVREGSQYEAIGDGFVSDLGEHIRGDEKDEGWVRVLPQR